MGKIYTNSSGDRIERVSKWIKIHTIPVTKRHRLYDYATDGCGRHPYQDNFDPNDGALLDYFVFQGKQYALEQFMVDHLSAWDPYYSANNVDDYVILSGYEADKYFHPLLIEICAYGELVVRVYRELPRE